MTRNDLPPEWWADSKMAWAMLDSARQDDELRRVAAEVAALKDKLEGKQKQDLDAAHSKIRQLQAAISARRARHVGINSALAAAVVGMIEIVKWLLQHWH